MTKAEFFLLALECGFNEGDPGLSGNSSDDEEAYVEEYPVGESLLKLAAALGVKIDD